MSWLSSLFHDIGTPSQWFGGSSTQNTSALDAQTASAKASADAALKAQTDANAIAAAAAVPQIDSESARSAADDQRRKLMAGSNFGIGMADRLGAPPVGFRLLSGQ